VQATRPQPPVLSVRGGASRRHPALASRWRGAGGPTPGAGISGQGGMGWADAVGGKGCLIFLYLSSTLSIFPDWKSCVI